MVGVAISVLTFSGANLGGGSDGEEGTDSDVLSRVVTRTQDTQSDDPLVVLASNDNWLAEPGFFDVERLGLDVVQADALEYDQDEYFAAINAEDARIRPVGVGERAVFWTDFTVANASQRESVIIRVVSLEIQESDAPPERLLAGCPNPLGAVSQPNISFQMQLDSELIGVEQPVSNVPEVGTVLELAPGALQAFEAHLSFSAAGVHTYRIVVHYHTSGGRSSTAVSEPLEVVLMPSAQTVEGVGPAEFQFKCRPGQP